MSERVPGIKRIRNEEEYAEAKKQLDRDVEQYKWAIQNGTTENMYKDISNSVDELTKKTEGGDMSEEDKHELSVLQRKFEAIKEGSYVPTLLNNIAASLVSLEEYDASKEDRSLLNVIVGILTGNKAVKEYVRKKYTFWLVDITGQLPGAEDMELESMGQIVEQIAGLVSIDPSMSEEEKVEEVKQESKEKSEVTTALVVVPENMPSRLEQSITRTVRQFLEERGISEEFPKVTDDKQTEQAQEYEARVEVATSPNEKKKGEKARTEPNAKEIED